MTHSLPPSAGPGRDLEWPTCYNVRDLGGLPTVDGAATRRQSIVRADILNRLNTAGRHALLDYGVRTIIDLRGEREIVDAPSTFSGREKNPAAPRYHNLRLDDFDQDTAARIARAGSRAELYTLVLDRNAGAMAAVLRTILAATLGAVVIHCHSGKDRTGLVAALLLDVAGVPRDLVAADYARSQERLWPLYEKMVAAAGSAREVDRFFRPVAAPETMRDTLAHLDGVYGGVPAYLRQAGLTDEEVVTLRARLRDD